MNYCWIQGCNCPVRYTIEWWGLNQHGENPIIEEELDVCSDVSHIDYTLHVYDEDCGEADNIMDIETGEDFGNNLSNFLRVVRNKSQLEFDFMP